MLEAFVIKVTATVLTFLVIAALGLVAGRGGGKESLEQGARLLGYGRFIRGLAILLALLLIGLLGSAIVAPPNDPESLRNGLIGFGVLGSFALYTAFEGFGTKVLLTDEGVAKFHWWYRTRFVPWESIDRIEHRPRNDGDYAIFTRDGRMELSIPPSRYFGPVEWFIEACRNHLTPEQYPTEFRSN